MICLPPTHRLDLLSIHHIFKCTDPPSPSSPYTFWPLSYDKESMKCYIRLDSTFLFLQLLLLPHYDTEELKQCYDHKITLQGKEILKCAF